MAKGIKYGTTLAGPSVTTVLLSEFHQSVEIVSRGGTSPADDFFVRTDQTDPTAAGDECELIQAGTRRTITNLTQHPDQAVGQTGATEVRIFCGNATGIAFCVAGR